MFFRDLPKIQRAQGEVSIRMLLDDMVELLDFFKKDEDDWFFDF